MISLNLNLNLFLYHVYCVHVYNKLCVSVYLKRTNYSTGVCMVPPPGSILSCPERGGKTREDYSIYVAP